MSAPVRVSRTLVAGSALAVAVFVAYAVALRGGFLWDDDLHITANPTIIGPLGLREIWTSARANYFPLVLTNFWFQHALWGLHPFGYHAVTLAFHALAAVLLWCVLRELRVPGAWVGATLWALHPVQVESVAWICELKNTQSAVFFLASIWLWLKWLDSGRGPLARDEILVGDANPGAAGRVRAFYVLAVVCALLALLSKSSTVMLPVALGLCAWWRGRRLDRRLARALAPFFALSAVTAGWTIWEQKFHSGAAGAEWAQTWPERFAIAGRAIGFYLGKLAWPRLNFIYPRWAFDAANPFVYVPLAVALAALTLLWVRRGSTAARAMFFAAAFFVALLFPVLGFFDVFFFRYSFVADHFQYLASMGPLALAGAGLVLLGARRGALAAAGVLVGLGALAAWQCRDYRDVETLWRTTVARNPAATMAWVNLGDTLEKRGAYDEALRCFSRSLELKPGMADVYNDMGCTLVLAGRPAEAVPKFERSLSLQPNNPEAHSNFGNALRLLGRRDEAIAHYRRALELDPGYGEAHNNLGAELAERGAAAEAVSHFEAALRAEPGNASAHNNFGNALRALGRYDEAVAQHRAALALLPDFAEAHASLGEALLLSGKLAEALPHLQRAIALEPDFSPAHTYLGEALMAHGRADEALAEFRRAAQLAPNSAEARNNLGSALAQRGELDSALVEFQAAVHAAPELVSARVNLGTALGGSSRWKEAAAQFERAAQLQPDSAPAHARLAVALVNAGELQRAVPEFETALRLDPRTAEVRNNFAQLLQALGRVREAHEQYEAAAQLSALRNP